VPYKQYSSEIDSVLLTASMWNMQSDSELLPTPGSVVDITEYSNLTLLRIALSADHPSAPLELGR
jgi:hypothetical protein